jgi:hypothetical protein
MFQEHVGQVCKTHKQSGILLLIKEELIMGMKNLPGKQNCNLHSRAAETYWALSHHAIYNLCPMI